MNIHLLRPLKLIAAADSHYTRIELFEAYARDHLLVLFVWKVHKFFQLTPIGTLMLLGYCVKSSLSIRYAGVGKNCIVAAWRNPNELTEIQAIAELMTPYEVVAIHPSVKSAVSAGSVVFLAKAVLNIHNLCSCWKLVRRIGRKHHFVTACRLLDLLGFFIRFRVELADQPPRAALIAGPTGPEGQALLWAAKSASIPSIFSSRANTPKSAINTSPIDADFALLEGQRSLQSYRAVSRRYFDYSFKGLAGTTAPFRFPAGDNKHLRFGIFLSNPANLEAIKQLVSDLFSRYPHAEILIRPHPLKMFRPDLSEVRNRWPIRVSDQADITKDILNCDFVFAGNSNSHVEILKSGAPTFYHARLDTNEYDLYGFVEESIVLEVTDLEDFPSRAKLFYSEQWIQRFKNLDASYGEDADSWNKQLQASILDFLSQAR